MRLAPEYVFPCGPRDCYDGVLYVMNELEFDFPVDKSK